jgi:hypothetical protein
MSKRKFVVNGIEVVASIGKSHTKINVQGKAYAVANHDLIGVTKDQYNDGQFGGSSKGMVKPEHICDYIESVVLNK